MLKRLVGVMMAIAAVVTGCATAPTATTDPSLSASLPPYNGPRARIAVARFDWKVGNGGTSISLDDGRGGHFSFSTREEGYAEGLETMLNSALVQSKRFLVLERENFGAIKDEIRLGDEGYMEQETRVNRGHVKGADIQVAAAVTGWEPNASEHKGGLGGLFGNTLGGGRFGVKKSRMAMDLRIYDARTSEILYATTVHAEAKRFNIGGLGGGFMGGIAMIGGLSEFKKTPMEQVIRVCIAEAVKDIVDNVPQKYLVN